MEMLFTKNTLPFSYPIVKASGSTFYTSDGKKYLDFCCQTLNLVLGQAHTTINQAVIEELNSITFASSRFYSNTTIELAKSLLATLPAPLKRVNLKNTSGSEANECAFKMARKKTNQKKIISFLGSHHGQTFETMRASGKHFKITYLGDRSDFVFLPTPSSAASLTTDTLDHHNLLLLSKIENLLERTNDIAAVVLEPIMVDAGVIILPRSFIARIREMCDYKNIALIFDEVQTCMGWLGNLYATNIYKICPDILTLSKALGAGFPLAAVACKIEYDVLEYGEHEITYGAHPVSCAASLAMLRLFNETDILTNAEKIELLLSKLLENLLHKFPKLITSYRGIGTIWAFDLNPQLGDNIAHVLVKAVLERGLLLRASKHGSSANVVQIKLPLIISEKEIINGFSILETVLDSFCK